MIQESGVGVWGKNNFLGWSFKKYSFEAKMYKLCALGSATQLQAIYNAWGRCAFDGLMRLSISN